MVLRARPSRAYALPLAVALATVALARAEAGATSCPVRVIPGAANSEWMAAGRAAEREMKPSRAVATCVSIEVRVADDTAHLTMTMPDGRQVERDLAEAFELVPTVEGLLVALEPRAPPEPMSLSSPIAPAKDEPLAPDERNGKRTAGIELGASAGLRAGAGVASPTVGAFAALRARGWELGVFGNWEISYLTVGSRAGPEWSASGLAAGVSMARRGPVSSAIDLFAGARFAGAIIHQEVHHERPEPESNDAEGRVGAFVGSSWPRQSPVRMRTELGVDYVPVGSSRTPLAPGAPVIPNWSAALTVGIEADGP